MLNCLLMNFEQTNDRTSPTSNLNETAAHSLQENYLFRKNRDGKLAQIVKREKGFSVCEGF